MKNKYVEAMKSLKFDENLKNKIIHNVYSKLEKKYVNLFPRTLISLGVIQMAMFIFSTSVESSLVI